MPNYKLKADVIALGLDLLQKNVSKAYYHHSLLLRDGLVTKSKISFEEAIEIDNYMTTNHFEQWQEARRINVAHYARVRRLFKKITKMLLSGKCIFLTFTFTDEILATTTFDTRKQYVRRFLSSYNCPYVANVDYGKTNGREHYHALIQIDKVNYNDYKYGASNGKRVAGASSGAKLAKYIAKLTNHAIKQTTKQNRIIYDRLKD